MTQALVEQIERDEEHYVRCVAALRRAEEHYETVRATCLVTDPERLLAFSAVQTCRANLDEAEASLSMHEAAQ